MTNLVEFKVSKTIFDDVKNDPGFRIGFEAEFHVENANSLLIGQPQLYDDQYGDQDDGFEEDEILARLCRLFETYLGLPQGDMQIGIPHAKSTYQKWTLTTDASLHADPNLLTNAHDAGVELVSPVMTLADGLAWMGKICGMIANFRHGSIRLYTTALASMHVNLSHVLMEYGFDYAKLAILGGDEHYLADFRRTGNKFAQPILKAVYDSLVAARENRAIGDPQPALNLLNLRNWNAGRVMYDLSMLIPLDHHMSIDFRRLNTANPYIEIRVAGNADYELRYDEIAKMAIRYAALIKIGCDPNAYRDEYLKKVYQLVSGAAPAAPQQNVMPKIRIYLQPVMSRGTRAALDQIEGHLAAQSKIPNAPYLVLTALRSAIDMRLAQSLRVREGLKMLLDTMGLKSADLMRALSDKMMLTRYGIMRTTEKPGQVMAMLTNAIKGIDYPKPMPVSNRRL